MNNRLIILLYFHSLVHLHDAQGNNILARQTTDSDGLTKPNYRAEPVPQEEMKATATEMLSNDKANTADRENYLRALHAETTDKSTPGDYGRNNTTLEDPLLIEESTTQMETTAGSLMKNANETEERTSNGQNVTSLNMTIGNTSHIICPDSALFPTITCIEKYQNNYIRLQKHILSQKSIVERIPPYEIYSTLNSTFKTIFMRVTPFKVLAVDEVEQSVKISCYITLKWTDQTLKWNRTDYGNIKNVSVKTSLLWTPRIFMPTSTGHGLYLDMPEYVMLLDNEKYKNIAMTFPFQFTVLCELDLSRYPFDEQSCEVVFTELNGFIITGKDNREREYQLIENLTTTGEWEIVRFDIIDNSWDGTFSSVRNIVTIRRRSMYYVANFLIPLILTALMTLLVFWIPAETGEKMSFLVSLFVSTSVFLFIIFDEMPRSITDLPLVNIVVTGVTCEIFLASIATVIVLHRYKHYLESIGKTDEIEEYENLAKSASKMANTSQKDRKCKTDTSPFGNKKTGSEVEPVRLIWHTKLRPFDQSVPVYSTSAHKEKGGRPTETDECQKEENPVDQFDIPCDDPRPATGLEYDYINHKTLDRYFFCTFLVINIVGATYVSLNFL